ncbi:MAG: hypothetical protein IKC75_03530 [Clostridia bacterium]|nr:hypothetical protein [Clostridia bacterium]
MWYCKCPICRTEYEHNPKVCTCGFAGLISAQEFAPPHGGEEEQGKAELFSIFKFAKHVLYGKIEYRPTHIYEDHFEEYTLIDAASELRALAVVDRAGTPPTIARDGLFAFDRSVRALILNTNRAARLALDESMIECLLLGAAFEGFEDGKFHPYRPLRYLHVHGDNPHFTSENNVLFDKKQTRLIYYSPLKPEAAYTVPRSVKTLAAYSFRRPRYLKTLRLPKGICLEKNALWLDEESPISVEYY